MQSNENYRRIIEILLTLVLGMFGWWIIKLDSRVSAYEEQTPITLLQEMRSDIKAIKAALRVP